MCTTDDTVRQIRHALRGELHTIMLCLDAVATAVAPAEQLEWLAFLEAGCDRVIVLLDRLAATDGPADGPADGGADECA